MMKKLSYIFFLVVIISNCTKPEKSAEKSNDDARIKVKLITDYGDIVIELYNETPKHRDNFLKLTNEGILDSVLFHRVIQNFMIQGGDPDSKYAQSGDTLGNGGLDYRVDAEFDTTLFHKKGALGAARDGNLARASSSTQFYIVQGKVFNDSLLEVAEGRINGWLKENAFKNDSSNQSIVSQLLLAEENEDWESYAKINDSIKVLANTYENFEAYVIPEYQRQVYKTVGGTPHLDQNYTVFGEVIEGLAVVDSIAATKTGAFDRPTEDIRIKSVTVIN